MRRLEFAAAAVAGVVFASGLSAQGTDFSGKWVEDAEKTQALTDAAVQAGDSPRYFNFSIAPVPITMTIRQDTKTITIESEIDRGVALETVYNLDGSENKNLVPGARQGDPPIEQVSTAKWDGHTLVVTTKTPTGNRLTRFYLESGELVLEMLVSERQGWATSTKVYYKKG